MRERKSNYFAVWLGVTILGAVLLAFLILTRYWPDFFQNMTFVL